MNEFKYLAILNVLIYLNYFRELDFLAYSKVPETYNVNEIIKFTLNKIFLSKFTPSSRYHESKTFMFSLSDYNQYTVNHTVPVQHQSVRITDVSSNSKQYHQKPKKVTVNEADKYNLNQDVTVQDYDIYDNQVCLNRLFYKRLLQLPSESSTLYHLLVFSDFSLTSTKTSSESLTINNLLGKIQMFLN